MGNSIIAYTIEGIGSDTSLAGGLALYHGLNAPYASSVREWWACVDDLPSPLSTSVNPYTGDWSTSGLTMVLSASDRVAALLMRKQRRIDDTLSLGISAASTTVTITSTTLAGEPIWVGDETILLGTHTGSGEYTGCTRGFWGSTAQAHLGSDGVYTVAPTLEGRLVQLIEHNPDTGAEVTRWRGFVTDIEMDGAHIRVNLEELLSVWSGAEINRDTPNLITNGQATVVYTPDVLGVIRGFGGALRYTSRVRASYTTGAAFALQVDDAIQRLNYSPALSSLVNRIEGVEPEAEPQSTPERVFEVFYVSPRSSQTTSTQDLTYPYHPIAIALALLMSTGTGSNGAYDVLTETWGLGIDYVALDLFEAAITANPSIMVDRLVLGWDGELVNVFDVIQRVLLRPFGYFLTVTATGLVGLGRLRLLDIEDWSNATANSVSAYIDGPLTLDRAMQSIPQVITATVGGAPWSEGQRVTVREPSRSTRLGRLQRTRETQLDYQVLRPERLGLTSNRTTGDLSNALVNLLQLQLDGVPRLHIRVADYQENGVGAYDLGNIYRVSDLAVEDAWITDKEGARTIDLTSVAYAGMLIGRSWDASNYSYTLELLLLNYEVGAFVRWRAPAAVVDVSSGADLDMLDIMGGEPTDAETFTVGDEVSFWTVDGVSAGLGTGIVTAVGTDFIELNADPGDVSGLVMRLATSDNYSNDTIFSLTPRSYAYLANASGQITEEDASTSDADIYGTEVYSGELGTSGGFGATFIGLDDDVYGPESAAIAQPLDTYIEHRMRSNERRIIEDGHQISWVPVTGQAGDYDTATNIRPYASPVRTTVLFVPWFYQPDLAQIGVYLIARAGDQSSLNQDYLLTLESRATQSLLNDTLALANSEALSPPFQPYSLELTLDDITRQEVAPLILWGRSLIDTVTPVDTSIAAASVVYARLSSDIGFYADSGASRPNDDQLDLMCSRPNAFGDSYYDHLQADDPTDDRQMVVTPQPQGGTTLSKMRLSYMQLRGLEIAQTYNDATSPASSAIRAQVPVLGETEGTHALRTAQAYNRIRPLWVGPVGDPTAAEDGWPTGYVTRHIHTNADALESDTLVLTAPVLPSTDDCQIVALLYVIPMHADFRTDAPDLETLAGEAPIVEWATWLTVEELTGGAEEDIIGTGAANPDVQTSGHYGTDVTGRYPALLQEALLQDFPAGLQTPYREGQLYDTDLPLVSLWSTGVTITRDASLEVPAIVRLHIQRTATDVDWRGAATQTDASLRLVIVGVSLWEVPV